MNYTNLYYGLEKIAITESQVLGLGKSTAIGSVIGALGGGVTGALSSDKENRLKNALIGAGVGAAGGAAVGRYVPIINIDRKIKKLTKIKGKDGKPDVKGIGLLKGYYLEALEKKRPFSVSYEQGKQVNHGRELYRRFMKSKKVEQI